MSSLPSTELTTALDVLAEPRRRYLLAALLEHEQSAATDAPSERLSIEALTRAVARVEQDTADVTGELVDQVHVTLVHAHVPRLADAGLVTTDADGDATTVAPTEHPILEAEWVRSVLADPTGDAFPADERTLNRTLEALRNPRRRTVCKALARRRGAVSVADLAATVAAQSADDGTRVIDATESASVAVEASLVHQHLPALSAAGLVEYDAEAREAALATDAPQWQADWLTDGPLAAVAVLVRRRSDRDGAADGTRVSDRPTADATPADEQTASETPLETATASTAGSSATNDDRLLWTLARPPAGRSSSRSVPTASTNSSVTEREER
ncbi:hypothetical protein ACFR99_09055 [Haloarchaeobius amylolyticus]|uniref:DUF7344 domain-containing protein n=1 Tax=Haloarchaeobius amylolyticus TaxID=1198296 RepID=A0ABD6BG75_9EURY